MSQLAQVILRNKLNHQDLTVSTRTRQVVWHKTTMIDQAICLLLSRQSTLDLNG